MTENAEPQSGTVTKADGTVCPATRYSDGKVEYTTTATETWGHRKAPAKLASTFTPND